MASARQASIDYRRRAFGKEPGRQVAFVCECADGRYGRGVVLTAAEYPAHRPDARERAR